jgi:predicted dehydrogenase
MEPLRIAIIGTGARAANFAEQLQKGVPHAELFAVCDNHPGRLARFVEQWQLQTRTFHAVDDLLQEAALDAVIVTVPEFAHAEVTVKILQADKHVYLEKPMARNIEECRAILEAEAASRTQLVLGFNLRRTPFYRKVREILDSGILGEVIYISAGEFLSNEHGARFNRRFHRKRKYSGGFLNTKCSHDLDLINWLLGPGVMPSKLSSFGGTNIFRPERAPAERCSVCPTEIKESCPYRAPEEWAAMHDGSDEYPGDLCAWTPDKDIVDNQTVMIEYENGVRVQFIVTMFAHRGDRTLLIVGQMGQLSGSLNQGEFEVIRSADGQRTHFKVSDRADPHAGGDEHLVKDFASVVRGEMPKGAGSEAGYLATLMAEKSDLAMQEGRTITFGPEDFEPITAASRRQAPV